MTISLTGANSYIRTGVLKDATLVVPDKGIGSLLTVVQVTNRLNRLIKTIETASKNADARDEKNRLHIEQIARIERSSKKNRASFFSIGGGNYSTTGGNNNIDGSDGGGGGGGGGNELLEGFGIITALKYAGKLFKMGASRAPILGMIFSGGSIAYDINKSGRISLLDAAAFGASAGAGAGSLFAGVGAIPGAIIGGVIGLGSAVAYNARDSISSAWTGMVDIVSKKSAEVKDIATGMWDSTVKAWNDGTATIGKSVHKAWGDFTDSASKYAIQIEDWIGRQGSTIETWLGTITSQLNQYLNSFELKQVAIDWLRGLKDWVADKFSTGGTSDAAGFRTGPQIPPADQSSSNAAGWGGPGKNPPTSNPGSNWGGPANNTRASNPGSFTGSPPVMPGTTQAVTGNAPAGGFNQDQLAARIKAVRPYLTNQECVELARKTAGISEGVTDWRRGQSIISGDGKLLPIGTPVATFMDRQGNQSQYYDGHQGVGISGNNTTHAAIIAGYLDKDGKPTKDASKVAAVQMWNQWGGTNPSGGPVETTYPYNAGKFGEKDASNYYSINGPQGNPLGSFNPLNAPADGKNTAKSASFDPSNIVMIGDSIAHRVQEANKIPSVMHDGQPYDTAIDGAGFDKVLKRIAGLTKADLAGKIIGLSLGSNEPKSIGRLQEAIDALKGLGVDPSNIKVMGYSSDPARPDLNKLNTSAKTITDANGISMFPLGAIDSTDHIHESNPKLLAHQMFDASDTDASASTVPNPSWPSNWNGSAGFATGTISGNIDGSSSTVTGETKSASLSAVIPHVPQATTIAEANGEPTRAPYHDQVYDAPVSDMDKAMSSIHRSWMDSIPTIPKDTSLAVKTHSDNH